MSTDTVSPKRRGETRPGMEPTDQSLPAPVRDALARSRIYKLFAIALESPEKGWLLALKDGFFVVALRAEFEACLEAGDIAEPALSQLAERLEAVDTPEGHSALLQEHTNLFVHPASLALPYQTEYTASHAFMKVAQLSDLMAFYRAFGMEPSQAAQERGDFIVTELEFMHVLSLKEANARLRHFGHIDLTVGTEKKFLREHLGRWINLFHEAVQKVHPTSVYTLILQLASLWIQQACKQFGIQPIPVGPKVEEKEEKGLCETDCPLALDPATDILGSEREVPNGGCGLSGLGALP